MDLLLLGSHTRFACSLIKWNLQRDKVMKPQSTPFTPCIPSPSTGPINKFHVCKFLSQRIRWLGYKTSEIYIQISPPYLQISHSNITTNISYALLYFIWTKSYIFLHIIGITKLVPTHTCSTLGGPRKEGLAPMPVQ